MPDLLSDEWLRALEAAARAAQVGPVDGPLVIQQVVTDGGSEVGYVIRVTADGVTVERGHADDADVTFTLDRATAEAVHRGELSAQVAFMNGRLRVGGDLARLTAEARELTSMAERFGGTEA